MKNVKKTTFLSICSSLCLVQHEAKAAAVLNIKNWTSWRHSLPEKLLLEGVNQFAVRISTAFYPDEEKKRYLPTIIEKFQSALNDIPSNLIISGRCERLHDACRVVCDVTVAGDREDKIIATAVVIVSKIQFQFSMATPEKTRPDLPLWMADITVDNQSLTTPVCLYFNSAHPLFSEHFPGYAVAPGAMVVDIIIKRLKLFSPWMRSLSLSKIKFITPILPNTHYCLKLQFLKNELCFSFCIVSLHSGESATVGIINFTLNDGD